MSFALVHVPLCHGMLGAIITVSVLLLEGHLLVARGLQSGKWGSPSCREGPDLSLQGRAGRVRSSAGAEAGCSSLLLLVVCAERRSSLCLTERSAKASQGLSSGEMI